MTWNTQNMKPAPETCFGISAWKRADERGDAVGVFSRTSSAP